MSSKLYPSLFGTFNTLSNVEIIEESMDTPAYHPFKYCLRYKKIQNEYVKETNKKNETAVQTEDFPYQKPQVLVVENSKTLPELEAITALDNKNENSQKNSETKNKITNESVRKCRSEKQNFSKSNTNCRPNSARSLNKITSKVNSYNYAYLRNNGKSLNSTLRSPSPRLPITAKKVPSKQSNTWKSGPYRSFTTTGAGSKRLQQFSYDLSRDELKSMSGNSLIKAMKPAKEHEINLLKTGQRLEYLTERYNHAPAHKYNYPEATSWRIGWLHQKI